MTADGQYNEILGTLHCLFSPGQVIEVRILSEDGISSGYFNDFEKAAAAIRAQDRDPRGHGIYVTLNEISGDLLARRANRIKYRIGKQDQTTADVDIIHRWWLPIDIDPVRRSGISSSESEHDEALRLAATIRQFLAERGWNDPILADSGNGAHLLYAIDLPNDEVSRDLVKSVLGVLDQRFSDERCRVDTANFNAARIWKVYGTTSRKGDDLLDRPHRRARIIEGCGERQLVRVSDLVSLITENSDALKDPSGNATMPMKHGTERKSDDRVQSARQGESSVSDLGSWLTRYGLSYTSKPYQGGTLFSLDSCPFSDAHHDGAFAIQFENGAIFAGCHHDSCGGGQQRWPELRAQFEPVKPGIEARLASLQRSRIRARLIAEGRIEPDDVSDKEHDNESDVQSMRTVAGDTLGNDEHEYEHEHEHEDTLIRQRAQDILTSGDPLAFFLETFAASHEGDQSVAECLVHSLVSRSVINSKGLHVSITGESGKGKSHAIETMKSLIPAAFRLEGRMSDKALFYMDDLISGTVITLDDVSLSDQMQEILKGVTTSFQKPFQYRTVSKDRKPQICTIPERCIWWIAKVEGAGDDQVFNRMLTCWIDDTEGQDDKVLNRTLAGAGEFPGTPAHESDEILVCRKIWDEITQVWVVIPFATRIRFQSSENRRNPDMLLDLIRTNAALCQQQRERRIVNGTCCVIASETDFFEAARLFVGLNGEDGEQAHKMTKRESALLSMIASLNRSEVTVTELQGETGWTNSTINKLIHGYQSCGKSYSGLLEKCPAISVLDRTESRGDGGYTTHRRSKAYLWDAGLYEAWMKCGSIWLAREDTDDDQIPPGSNGGGDESETKAAEPNSAIDEECAGPDTDECRVHGEPGTDQAEGTRGGETGNAGTGEMKPGNRPVSGVSIAMLAPGMFVPVGEFPDHKPCSVCGKRPTQYRERITGAGEQEQDGSVLMLCYSCYQRVVSREAATMMALPGVIDTGSMVRLQTSSRKCDLCSLTSAIWSDPHSRTQLCDSCYQREVQRCSDSHPKTDNGPP
ncbi:MAG: hypothetical protein LUQ50_15285 [Methanospirillum sp.]|uniref:hypothetical protein n=1 Tax=Methanospirillum sp. TaxID=45200 RepID=UPI002372A3A5|nr:hypothetical protein [Methanospirillum sp.]MDD1730417.1 hypothetical protein [Methanospirillum sp.]